MGRGATRACALAIGLSLAGAAAAQDDQGDVNVFVRGGIGGYTGELGESSEAGPTWGVAVNLQPSNVLGFELGYEGGKHSLSDARTSDDSSLSHHGASALLKLGLPLVERVKPFVGAGLGASYVDIDGDPSGLYRSDFVQSVPVAGGLEFNSGALTAGARVTYRFLFDESFADRAQPGTPEGGLFDAALTLGGRF